MGEEEEYDDNPNPNPPFLLPPGCRFFPSDDQLLSIYLTQKHSPRPTFSIPDVIKEINLYDYEPFNLPDSICFRFGKGGRKRHYYCYVVARVRDEETRRGGRGGYWKRTGRVRDVVLGNAVLGTRRAFVFYLGDFGSGGKGSVRTDWFMYEYALVDPNLVSLVLCRVFIKSRKSNTNTSDRPLSSCAQDSVAKVRHVGIQHDGTVDLVPTESNMLGGNSADRNNQVLRLPMELVRRSDNVVIGWPVDLQLGSYGQASARGMMANPLTAEQLTAIMEDDFLELDDLLSPYPGVD